MTSWAEFQAGAPELAAAVSATFAVRKHATMATVRRDGAPRISGTELTFTEAGELELAMMPGTRRADDLRRDPRIDVHSPTDDPPESDPGAWLGESKLSARVTEVDDNRFRLSLRRVVLTRIAGGALEVSVWEPGAPVRVLRRG